MKRQTSPIRDADGHALDRELCRLEASVYRTLHGTIEACDDIAARAEALGLPSQRLRARLLASDVRSRLGHAAEARAEQLSLYEAAQPWPMLARHAATYLVSSCDRLGLRVEAMRWAQASLSGAAKTDTPAAWHAEALMVAALFSVSHNGADYTLVDRAMAAVHAACEPVMVAATAANFAEVTAECGELVLASHFADEAEALMLRHPEATSALSWESVARARLASSELSAAEHAMRESLRLEERFGCCDVNGDPWLTYADVMLARGDAPGALAMLEHPRRIEREASSAWTNTRDLRVRAQVLAALHRWEEAYERMVQYSAAYERARSIEGDRAVAESSAAVAIDEERRRSAHFERLALTDPLTGLPNRRHAERWLSEHAGVAGDDAGSASNGLCVAIADLDHFKRINDTHSHDAGDLVLQRVGTVLLDAFGTAGNEAATPMLAARLGGEEFLLAWSGISIEAALRHGNALCERLRATSFTDIVGGMPVTASLGVACGVRPVDPSALLRAADQCLYQAKRAGRDRVVGTSLP
jgi:diguanylate cyclase (GGDEF)-like protein